MANCLTCIHQEVCKERMEIFNLPNIACQYEAHELVGEWIIRGDNTFITCNKCGYVQGVNCIYFRTHFEPLPNFCENCGAKMVGDSE